MSEIAIESVPYDSQAYRDSCRLRDEILRRPLGLTLSAEDIGGEDEQWHLVALEQTEVVGCVVLKPTADGLVQLRQMAVCESHRGSGLGRRLLEESFTLAQSESARLMTLNAREPAIGFYRKAGFEVYGEGFVWHGVPHRRMHKTLGDG